MIRIYHLSTFLLYYIFLVFKANIQIAIDILSPGINMDPGIVELKLKLNSENQVLMFSNLISMTPGSLALSHDEKDNILWVHLMQVSDYDSFLKNAIDMQNKIIKITN